MSHLNAKALKEFVKEFICYCHWQPHFIRSYLVSLLKLSKSILNKTEVTLATNQMD